MFNIKMRKYEWLLFILVMLACSGIGVIIFGPRLVAQVPDAPAVATMKGVGYGDALAYESLTVSSTSKAMTSATYTTEVKKAFCTLETNAIRFTLDGINVPTSAGVGHKLEVGQTLTLNGYAQIALFRAVRSSATDAALKCTYLK